MAFESYLTEQLLLHPSMQIQDIVKLCYQASHGAEHLLENKEQARVMLENEYKEIQAKDFPLFEEISDDVIRINLSAWKFKGWPLEWLFNIFTLSAGLYSDAPTKMEEYLEICRNNSHFSGWEEYLDIYRANGMPPVHHSDVYRECEQPSYRMAKKQFAKLFPIFEMLSSVNTEPCVIVIEGRAASGKTTFADKLGLVLGADIIHMDDFFLPPELRTAERLEEAGGNIDYDRFLDEVIHKIKNEDNFSYRVFSCGEMDFAGYQEVKSKKYRIVEGVYSMHPCYGDYAEIYVFMDVDSEEQIARIEKRNGKALTELFASSWIPMEEKYFSTFKVKEKCIIHIK